MECIAGRENLEVAVLGKDTGSSWYGMMKQQLKRNYEAI